MSTYQIEVVTLSPTAFSSLDGLGVIGRALASGIANISLYNPRDFTHDNYHKVDDEPYGGGAGMVLKPEPFFDAVNGIPPSSKRRVLMMTPQGKQLSQEDLWRWSQEYEQLVLLCGQYEGFDERIRTLADEEVSIGDFVLTGGEIAAMTIINGVIRLLPGTVGSSESLMEESFSDLLLEHPQYTRPAKFHDLEVPEVLRNGNHGEISRWRQEQREIRTKARRPELYERWIQKELCPNSKIDLNSSTDLDFCMRKDFDQNEDPWWE